MAPGWKLQAGKLELISWKSWKLEAGNKISWKLEPASWIQYTNELEAENTGELEVAPRNQRSADKLETPYELEPRKIATTDFWPAAGIGNSDGDRKLGTRRARIFRRSHFSGQIFGRAGN